MYKNSQHLSLFQNQPKNSTCDQTPKATPTSDSETITPHLGKETTEGCVEEFFTNEAIQGDMAIVGSWGFSMPW